MTTTRITCKLSEIRLDGGTQPRTSIDEAVVRDYARAIAAGDELPPVEVVWDGVSRWLSDGFHRWHGHESAGSVEIECNQRNGTRRDAILLAAGANGTHGLRRTADDVRRAIRMLLEDEEWGKWSDRDIAKAVGCTHPTVGDERKKLAEAGTLENFSSERRFTTRHGTAATMDTANIGRSQAVDRKKEPRKPADPQPQSVEKFSSEHEDSPDAAQLLDEMQADLRKAEARVAELEKALKDGGKEQVVALLQRLDHAERRQAELQEDARRWQDRAERYERLLARCGKAIGDRDLDHVAPKVEAMARKLRELKVAA